MIGSFGLSRSGWVSALALLMGHLGCAGGTGGSVGAGGTASGGAGGSETQGSAGIGVNAGGSQSAGTGVGGSSAGNSGMAGLGGTAVASGGSGTGGTTAGSGGAPPPAGKVPVFVAQGSAGRITISCDDGKTWAVNHAWDSDADTMMCGMKQSATCYVTNCSYSLVAGKCEQRQCCSDTPDVAKGVAYGNGTFVATWGWGSPGSVRRSGNGIDWTTTIDRLNENSFGGLAFGAGHFVLASPNPRWSADGSAWTRTVADFRAGGSALSSVRRFAHGDYQGGGRFVAVAAGGGRDVLVSSDGGQTWWRPKTLPANCAGDVSFYGGIVGGNDILVIVDSTGNACRSTDGGQNWTVAPTGVAEILSHGVWTGTEFRFWGSDNMLSSTDGATWKKTKMLTPMRIGPAAIGPSGTMVATANVWDGYDKQVFMRTTDGLTWQTLAKTAFAPSHPIFFITAGYAEPSTCP